jgi:hypothetical protein
MAKEGVSINLNYSELRKFLVELYKEAINSYADLAESVVDEKIQNLIQKKHIGDASSVQFNLVDDVAEKANKQKEMGISSSWARSESISSFGPISLPSYNTNLNNLTGTVEINSNSTSYFPYVVSGDTIMFSGGSSTAN